jgi:hypothetical protein
VSDDDAAPVDTTPTPDAVRTGSGEALRFRIGVARPGTRRYRHCVDLVKQKYTDRYGAVIEPCPDLFVTVEDHVRGSPTFGRTLGVAGLTAAAGRRLLSENYLNGPVEDACAALDGVRPDRSRIAELGQVSSFHPGAGLFLVRGLPLVAARSGYDFLLATLTERLHCVAKVAGWDFRLLTNARRADLAGNQAADWGNYYAARPRTGLLRCGERVVLPAAGWQPMPSQVHEEYVDALA